MDPIHPLAANISRLLQLKDEKIQSLEETIIHMKEDEFQIRVGSEKKSQRLDELVRLNLSTTAHFVESNRLLTILLRNLCQVFENHQGKKTLNCHCVAVTGLSEEDEAKFIEILEDLQKKQGL